MKRTGGEANRRDDKMSRNHNNLVGWIIDKGRIKVLFVKPATAGQRQIMKKRSNAKRRRRDRGFRS